MAWTGSELSLGPESGALLCLEPHQSLGLELGSEERQNMLTGMYLRTLTVIQVRAYLVSLAHTKLIGHRKNAIW